MSSSQYTDLVMKVCSDNLFVHNLDSTPVVVILQSTHARLIDEVIEDDIKIMHKTTETAFFEKIFDL